MYRAVALLALSLASVALAGCIGSDTVDPNAAVNVGDVLGSQPGIAWESPQTAAHPAFGWPTLTNPAQGLAADASLSTWWKPIEAKALPDPIQGLDRLGGSDDAHTGAGIALFGRIAVVPGWSSDAHVYDITDPTAPVLLSKLDGTPGRDADFIAYPDGRLVLVMASDYGVNPVWDLTDPENPVSLGEIEPTAGSHNIAVVPGTPIVYNANSAGGGRFPVDRTADTATGITEIYDLSDPAKPVLVQDWQNGFGCHDITFYVNAAEDKHRAYCAGIQMTQIWDIADPANPTVLANVPVHHGVEGTPSGEVPFVLFSHLAMVNHDATVLIVGDETGGGAAPACDAYVDAGARTVSGPLGNLYFYDLTDETNPQLRSWLSPTHHYPTNPPTDDPGFLPAGCTAHFGRVVEDTGLLAMAFYGAGVLLIDFTDLDHPVIVEQWNDNTNVWDVWYHQGYLFTGDLQRGFDVLGLL